jgi:protein-S-isoprenylcysteine O-methyltransferase Ste14
MYVKLAKSEERESIAEFGDTYRKYIAEVPAFFPRLDRFLGGRTTSGRAP